jgi:hypothetical protein
MSKQVQCHLTTPSTTGEINKVEWVDEAIKPKADMVIPFKGDSRIWTVKTAYVNTPREGV